MRKDTIQNMNKKWRDWRLNEAKSYNTKADALNAYFKGSVSADEVVDIAKEQFNVSVATKQELNSFLNNKFLQEVMADTHNITVPVLVKKVKELLKKI